MTNLTKTPKNVLTCDILAVRHIPVSDLEKERDLRTKTWWDYRALHPVRRTELFAATYRRLYQRYTGKYKDYARSEFVSGQTGPEDIFQLRGNEKQMKARRMNLLGFWRGRQAADELGISYSIYIGAIFEFSAMKGWQHFPRPTQLYSDRMKVVALDAQVMELERFIPDFHGASLKAGSNAPWKKDFDAYLYELGALRRHHKGLAFNRMATQGYITEAQARDWEMIATT